MNGSKSLSDDELVRVLDDGLWVVRGGSSGVLGVGTLHGALQIAAEASGQGHSPGPIVRSPHDEIVIGREQIARLWNRVGIKV